MNGMDIFNALFNTNTAIILVLTGTLVWVIRQIIPKKVEEHKVWKVSLRVLPVLIGGGLALIPGIVPVEGNMAQSVSVGLIAGSFSQSSYDLIRELVSGKIKALMGGKDARNSDEG
jgi:drug/metabolite transporter (DMT)-like permease